MSTHAVAGTFEDDDILFGDLEDLENDLSLDVTCPGCGARLNNDPTFAKFRICPHCSRHFWLPARERLDLVIDPGSFRETNAELVSVDPLVFRDAIPRPDRVPASGEAASYPISEALITGFAKLGGRDAVVAVVDFALLGDVIGAVAGEKLVLAIELAISRRLPLITLVAGGAQRDSSSMLSLVQASRISTTITRLQRTGVAMVSVLSHPTAGAVYTGFACHANLLFAEPGSQIGRSVVRTIDAGMEGQVGTEAAETLVTQGMLDGIVDRRQLRDQLVTVLDILTSRAAPRIAASGEAAPISLLTAQQETAVARNPGRPSSFAYIERLMPGFVELRGDRDGSDDDLVRIGIGQLDGVSMGVVAVDRRVAPDSGKTGPASGYRKANRLYRLASLLELPVVTLIDGLETPRDSGGSGAETGWMLAQLSRSLAAVPVPTVAVIVGEVNGARPMAFSVADRTLMLEHAVYSTAGSETGRPSGVAPRPSMMPHTLTSRDCRRFGLVDSVVAEPAEGAHADPSGSAQHLRLAIIRAFGELSLLGPRRLQDERNRKYRQMGLAGPAGSEAIRLEIAQLQEWQRTVGKSLDDLRSRIEQHHLTLPAMPHLPHRPGMPSVGLPLLPNLPSFKRPAVNRAEIADLAGRLASTGRGFAERVSDVRNSLAGEDQSRSDRDQQPD